MSKGIDTSEAAAALGRIGGKARSERKTEACRENGKKNVARTDYDDLTPGGQHLRRKKQGLPPYATLREAFNLVLTALCDVTEGEQTLTADELKEVIAVAQGLFRGNQSLV